MSNAFDEQAEEIERLKELLKEYGRHGEGCNYPFNKSHGCDKVYNCKCGYLREVVPALAEKPRSRAEKPEVADDQV